MRCTCAPGPNSHGTIPEICPVHGQRDRDAAPGGRGVPVLDLTQTITDLRNAAETARVHAQDIVSDAEASATDLRSHASYLDSLADALDGKG